MMNNLLENKVCLITGAGRGMGRVIAEKFLAEGAIVYAIDILEKDLEWVAAVRDGEIHAVVLDICDFDAVQTEVMKIKKAYGRIDVLVNNAGLISYELLTMIDFDHYRKMYEVNVVALVNLMQMCARVMMRQQCGSIVNMASIVGLKGAKGQLAYSTTKGAVISATLSAAKELAEHHIRVNAIAPGMVATARFKAVLEDKFADRINSIPFGRLAEPAEIANTALYLASDMSSYVTGQVIGVDGGATI